MYVALKNRIDQLERLRHNHQLRVLAQLPDGSSEEMSVDEMLDRGLMFIRVISGDSLIDLDKILDYQTREACKE